MGINPKSPNSNGLESWPITKTKFFRIGRDPLSCQVVIDYENADPVHLILSNETNRAFETRFAFKAAAAAQKLQDKKKESVSVVRAPSVATAPVRSMSRRASKQITPPVIAPNAIAEGTVPSKETLPSQSTEPMIPGQQQAMNDVDDSNVVQTLPSDPSPVPAVSAPEVEISSNDIPSSSQEQQPEKPKTDFGNQWYIRVMGSLGVYINNYYYSSSATR